MKIGAENDVKTSRNHDYVMFMRIRMLCRRLTGTQGLLPHQIQYVQLMTGLFFCLRRITSIEEIYHDDNV